MLLKTKERRAREREWLNMKHITHVCVNVNELVQHMPTKKKEK